MRVLSFGLYHLINFLRLADQNTTPLKRDIVSCDKASKSGKDSDWNSYRHHYIQRPTKKISAGIKSTFQARIPKKNNDPVRKYIKARDQDIIGIAPIKDNTSLFSDSEENTEALNRPVQSVFTKEPTLKTDHHYPHSSTLL